METREAKDILVSEVSKLKQVKGIGQTSDVNEVLVPGQSDIDMFVLCTEIPSCEERMECYSKHDVLYSDCMMKVCEGWLWGTGDILVVNGVDTMFMYFTIEEMNHYVSEVLEGKHMDKEGDFYPVGRLATIHNMNVLYEEDSIYTKLIERVKDFPEDFAKKMFFFHLWAALDEEDVGRVLLRKEIFFYHQVLENALDHLLQAVYTLNKTYFPSRKRVQKYMNSFTKLPENCYERFQHVIENSVHEETIEESVKELQNLRDEIKVLGEKEFQ